MTNLKEKTANKRPVSRQIVNPKQKASQPRPYLIVIGLVGIVTLVAVFLIVLSVLGADKIESANTKSVADDALPLYSDLKAVNERFAKGATTAKVVLTEYADFQCPACNYYFSNEEPRLYEEYVKTGKVKMVFATFPFLDYNSPAKESHVAAEAAYCAADQKRFWAFHDSLFTNQLPENSGRLTSNRMKQMADQLGLDQSNFSQCLDSHKYSQTINQDFAAIAQKGINSTPSFAINGQVLQAANPDQRPSYAEIKAALDRALAAAK